MCQSRLVVFTLVAVLGVISWLATSLGSVPAAAAARQAAPVRQVLTTTALVGDPILTYSGAYWRQDTDLAPSGRNPLLSFTRAYYSGLPADYGFGIGWSSNYSEQLVMEGDGKGTITVAWQPFDEQRLAPSPDGRYRLDLVTTLTVTKQTNGAMATDQDGTQWVFDAKGYLQSITNGGWTVALSYAAGRLMEVRDPASQLALSMHYNSDLLLTSITSSLSPMPVATYTYTGFLLQAATDSAGHTLTYGYAPGKYYLTTVTDSHGVVQVTNTYDTHYETQYRVVAQQTARDRATGQWLTLTYTPTPDGGQVTTIVEPALPTDPTFHPTRVDTFDPQGRITQQVIHFDRQDIYTAHYGLDAQGLPVVVSSDATYTATPPGPVLGTTGIGGCRFTLGFKTLADLLPATVGDCLDDEQHAANGDALQHTTGGLLVWRKADNWTAFTDGYRTWVNGPGGVMQRLNTQRFPWEANPDHLPLAG